jgi:hypothetical protein
MSVEITAELPLAWVPILRGRQVGSPEGLVAVEARPSRA